MGELDFLSTFLYPLLDDMLEFSVLSAVFYVIFLMLMPVLLNNLLVWTLSLIIFLDFVGFRFYGIPMGREMQHIYDEIIIFMRSFKMNI